MSSLAMFDERSTADRPGRLPRLVVLIPALNEEATIGQVIGRVPRRLDGIGSIEVIVIDDGSKDRTVELARDAGARVVSHGCNRGVGAAFATGMDAALRHRADVIVNMDGDGQFSPEDIPALIAPILAGRAGFVTCTRFANPDYVPQMPRVKLWGNRAMSRLVTLIAGRKGPPFTDVSCGFRAYTRDTALKLNLFGQFTYTQETFIDLAAKQVPIAEVPLRVRGERQFGKSRVARNLWRYAFQTSSIMLRALRDRKPLLVFGSVGLATFAAGALMGLFMLVHLWMTGNTSPYRSVIAASVLCLSLGVAFGVLAFIADMMGRVLLTQDRLLAMMREQMIGRRAWEESQESEPRPSVTLPANEGPQDEVRRPAA
jgi:glycosyltransferase involved in cell wall biosynthesis